MARQSALPANLQPRLINREAAAAYVSVSPTTFDQMVKDGTMPQPKIIHGRRLGWDVRELDAAIDRLPKVSEDSSDDTTWDDINAPPIAPIR
jgi:predicted DNA-binding transcriptional regulator AlpA